MDMNEKPADAEVIPPVVEKPAALAPRPSPNAAVRLGTGVLFSSVSEVWAVADGLRKGGAAPPKSTTGSVAAAILKGQTLGLDPITSMSQITVVNGRASLMGDLALALVRRSGFLASYRREWIGQEGTDGYGCRLYAKRKDTGEEAEYTFTFGEAKRAGLCRTAMWSGFTKRMVYYRTLGFLLRDLFSDVLMGLYLTEELQDESAITSTTAAPAALPQDARPADPFFEPAEEPAALLTAGPDSPQEAAADPVTAQESPEAASAPEAASPAQGDPVEEGGGEGIAAIFDDMASKLVGALQADAAAKDPFEGFRDPAPVPEKVVVRAPARENKRAVRRPAVVIAAPQPTSTVTVVRNPDATVGKSKRLF